MGVFVERHGLGIVVTSCLFLNLVEDFRPAIVGVSMIVVPMIGEEAVQFSDQHVVVFLAQGDVDLLLSFSFGLVDAHNSPLVD